MPYDELSIRIAIVLAALALDGYFAEVSRFHPLVGFGNVAMRLEGVLNIASDDKTNLKVALVFGVISIILLLTPIIIVAYWLSTADDWGFGFQLLMLYFALGGESLAQHGLAVKQAMDSEGLSAARRQVGFMVSRDSAELDECAVARSAVESVLENGCDAVFGAIFWFLLLGGVGAVLYRLVNTLDAMWGYRNHRYRYFGWAAARFDDLLNYIPARLTALTYLLLGNSRGAYRSWLGCRKRKSPNSTLVMAAGAGALQIRLGGRTVYQGVAVDNPTMGEGAAAEMVDIERAVSLLRRGVLLWAGLLLLMGVLDFA
ncbi:MAG: cobalamin biosynthesis protein CobD [Magnetococcales bacterium]|nr:cobalamin biosynthesis protein CobD [Magnetococcales bacterium]